MKRLFSILLALFLLSMPLSGAWAGTTYTYGLTFSSGGTHEVVAGDTLTGALSGATAVVTAITISGGDWGGTAAGVFVLTNKSGTFEAENLNEGSNLDVCAILGTAATVAEVHSITANKDVSLLTFTITAEGDGGAIPVITTERDLDKYLFLIESNPGDTAPSALWDFTFTDEGGNDTLGGEGADRSATATETIVPKIDAVYGARFIDGTAILTITNNSVNDANIVIKFYMY